MESPSPIDVAIIGGTGVAKVQGLEIIHRQVVHTPYGAPSGPFIIGKLFGKTVLFLARHGAGHSIPPHQINYRANIWALRHLGVRSVIAVAASGGIHPDLEPEDLVIPHQIIDYTWGRKHTFFEGGLGRVSHIDFSDPYCEELRKTLIDASAELGYKVHPHGVYGATQGPRLETVAEIDRMERDGCDVVGMTGMPEAALARELNLCYAAVAIIANKAAGRGPAELTIEDIQACLEKGVVNLWQLLEKALPKL